MHGLPALPPGFSHFPYINPDAPKGGELTLGHLGTFDSLNPFIIKGVAAAGIREFVYESLLARSMDEAFSLYGHIAQSIDVPEDRGFAEFHLRPEARFSDGRPITPDDVIFTWGLLKDLGQPYHRSYYNNVAAAHVTGRHSVRFEFAGGNREMPLIMGLMPVLPRYRVSADTFEHTSLEPPIGSGPYAVAEVDAGRRVVLRKVADWWARDLPVTRGRFNFDEIRFDYFRDAATLFEAFKAGAIALREEDSANRWATGYDFPAIADGRIVKRTFALGVPAGMNALALNTRRPILADQRVRQALMLLFDFEWINRSLFHSLYTRTCSFFERSELSSCGRPADARESSLLAPFVGLVRKDVFEGTWAPPGSDGSGFNRDNARAAIALLSKAGYELRGGRMVHAKSGAPLEFEALVRTRAQERLLLAFADSLSKVGIDMRIRQVDQQQYWKRLKTFDFDLIQWAWSASLSPGSEQVNRWHSSGANVEGSLNYPGVANAAVDAMIEAMLKAREREDFVATVRALDRVLLSGDYVVPLFHPKPQWIAHWTRVTPPERPSLYGSLIDTWWSLGDAR
jgi:peptide/nickel transport system substrate-binding protein